MMAGDSRTQGGLRISPQQTGKSTTYIIVLGVVLLLCFLLNSLITDAPIRSDARQNLQSAYNIQQWGVFSRSTFLERPSPDNYREPLPPAITAAFIFLLGEKACVDGDCREHGFNIRTIKKINILWACIVLCASALLAYRITLSRFWTVAVVILIYFSFLRNPAYIDSLYTEIPAAAGMLLSALCLMTWLRAPKPLTSFLAGIILGCLVLTKAIFFYVLFPLLVVAAVFVVSRRRRTSLGHHVKCLLMVCIGVLITIGPWLVRNTAHFGSAQIASRGGLALYTRALINQMDPYEYLAAFHYWGPGAYRRLVYKTALDIDDRDYERGGRAVRLNDSDSSSFFQDDVAAQKEGRPEDAVSFYGIARAQRVKAAMEMRNAGHRHAAHAADTYLRSQALRMIVKHPLRHLSATVPLAWRGMWCFYGAGVLTILGAVAYGSFLFVCLYGVVRKRWDIVALIAVPFLLLLCNAFLSNNLPRFNAPAIPFMVMSMAFALQLMAQWLGSRFKMRGNNSAG